MRILYISSESVHMGSVFHYRCRLPGEFLKKLGHQVRYYEELAHDEDLLNFDVIVFQLQTHPRIFQLAQAAKLKGVKVVYETDDNHFAFDQLNPYKYADSFKEDKLAVMRDFLKLSHMVTCTNEGHAQYLKRFNKNVVALPNSFDLATYPKKVENQTKRIRVGISGSASHFGDWLEIVNVYTDMLKKYPQTKLVFLGKPYKPLFGHLDPKSIEYHSPVVFPEYYQTLADLRLDFALVPLQDTVFNNQGKSNVKGLEYGAVKVPVVASRVYPYESTITHGVDGFLAHKYADWMSAIDRLVTDKELRVKMGQAIYNTIQDNYEIRKTVHLWEKAYKSICSDLSEKTHG